MKYYIYTIIAIVLAAVVAGFFIVGSPKSERLHRLDDQRVGNLQFIQSEIVNYWVNKARLPVKLSDLADNIRGISVPNDPETSADYEYLIKGPLAFSLCASFSLPTAGAASESVRIAAPKPVTYPGYPYGQDNWQHAAGRVCFDRAIDKDFYKPNPPVQK